MNELRLPQLTRVMYAVWEKMGAEDPMGQGTRWVRTRMLGGVGRTVSNDRPYPISPEV